MRAICFSSNIRSRYFVSASLWIQERQREGDLEICKVLGTENPGDALTKYLERILLEKHMARISIYPEDGRAASAPQVIAQILGNLNTCEDGGMGQCRNNDVEDATSKEEC